MVDDPYTFGQIAATNALSDVYAMGGEVKTALNLVCFPEDMDLNVLVTGLKSSAWMDLVKSPGSAFGTLSSRAGIPPLNGI